MPRLNELSDTFRHYNGDKYQLKGECLMFPDTPAVRLVKLPQTYSGKDEVVISLDIFEAEFIPFAQWSSNKNMERDSLLALMHETLKDTINDENLGKLTKTGRIMLAHLNNLFEQPAPEEAVAAS